MKIKWIAVFVIAALLTTGAAAFSAAPAENGAQIPAADAENLALKHAGTAAEQVTGLRSVYDLDDGVPEYKIKFRTGDWEYEYTVHAETGVIRDWDKDFEPQKENDPAPTEPAPTEPAKTAVTAQEGVAIALAHAGLTAEQVKKLECEYDVERGIAQWEVEFEFDGWEYEYEIEAATGNILKAEKDWDD